MKVKFNKKKATLLLVVVVLGTGLFSFSVTDKYFQITKNLDIFATLYREVNYYYVDDVNPNTLMRTGIEAMLENLDPYTNYIPEDAIEDFRTQTTGEYGGIGAIVGYLNNKHVVLMPSKGYAAERSGMKVGDEVIAVNGIDITGMNHTEATRLLKGQIQSNVKLTVRRYGVAQPIEFDLTREKITIKNVPYHGMVANDVAYIKLAEFTTEAGKEVRDALRKLEEEGAKKVILDLRGNLGGLLIEAVNTTNVFVPKGELVVSTKGKIEELNQIYSTLNSPVNTNMPLVVLTSSMSASASEIVAGSIQDYDRGVVVGQKSFGKGLVQATRPLSYNSQLKVTTAKYYTPSGRCIQALDYSNRRPDGSVGKVPDSLKSVFYTKNGREVFDGGGVDPDIVVELPENHPVVGALIRQGLILDYATQYYYTHESIAAANEFELTDAEIDAFIDWLKDKEYSYTTPVETAFEALMAKAEDDLHYEELKASLAQLKEKISHDNVEDVKRQRKVIGELLKEEIARHYYFEQGGIQASFTHDPDMQAAIDVLNDPTRYQAILEGKK